MLNFVLAASAVTVSMAAAHLYLLYIYDVLSLTYLCEFNAEPRLPRARRKGRLDSQRFNPEKEDFQKNFHYALRALSVKIIYNFLHSQSFSSFLQQAL